LNFEELDEEATRVLGRLVREAWNEGPPAPSADFLLAAIRPALSEIDRERRARPSFSRALDGAFSRLAAFLRPSPALAMAAAGAFLFMVALVQRSHDVRNALGLGVGAQLVQVRSHPSPITPVPDAPKSAFQVVPNPFANADYPADGLGSVYDVSPVRRPAVLFHSNDGAVTLWVIDDGDLSQRNALARPWG
jgi:hypothetical protein